MSHYDVISIALTVIGVLMLPLIGVLIRGMIRWVRTEDQLKTLIISVEKLVIDKDNVHREILTEMRNDRVATNTRLRYLEEYFMNHGMRKLCLTKSRKMATNTMSSIRTLARLRPHMSHQTLRQRLKGKFIC